MQQKISINSSTYDKIKSLATRDYRSITKELEYIINIYEDYILTQSQYPSPTTVDSSSSSTNTTKRKAIIDINSDPKNDFISIYERIHE